MTNIPPPGRGFLAKFPTAETNKITNARGDWGGGGGMGTLGID